MGPELSYAPPGAHLGSRIYQQILPGHQPDQRAPMVGRMAGDLIFPGLFVSTYESPSLENVHGKKKTTKKSSLC